MTLDTLEMFFEPLLIKYPHCTIILVGLPGLPNTVWSEVEGNLNSDIQALSISSLLKYLKAKNRIAENVNEPIYFLAFGTGGYTLSKFIALHLSSIAWCSYMVKAIILVNSLVKYNSSFRQVCRELHASLKHADHHELNELITSLHLSEDFISTIGKPQVLKKFWESRRGL